jgi:hypothetical protein
VVLPSWSRVRSLSCSPSQQSLQFLELSGELARINSEAFATTGDNSKDYLTTTIDNRQSMNRDSLGKRIQG